jgi:transcriptional regulator with XRE-family HTH domain
MKNMAVIVSIEENLDIQSYYDALTLHIKQLRKERKISQLKLAHILGHNSTSFIARIELRQNNANYNLSHLLILAQEWNLDIHDMLPPIVEK